MASINIHLIYTIYMFSSLRMRIILGIYIFIIISIPIGAYLASEQTIFKGKAQEKKTITKPPSSPKASPAKNLNDLSEGTEDKESIATSFGPTLSLKVALEGRPKDKQSGKLFVGIIEGLVSLNPKFLLSFTIDVPAGGEYSGLSLAGLTPGTRYSALLKGPAQIASASAFIMTPTVSNLNSGDTIALLTGDLNEDNTINSQDYSIAQKAQGSTSKSSNWNENADFNKDGTVNAFDLAIITKNFGKIGDSGPWTSPIPTKEASKSAGLVTPPNSGGYWFWLPSF